MIPRVQNWPTLLASFLDERRTMPFAWGTNDCCLFAADWVNLCTGTDLADFMRGKYSTALEAKRYLAQEGGVRGILRSIGEPYGLTRIDAASCQRGDLVVADTGNGESIGISIGSHAAFVGTNGLLFAPFDFQRAGHCWRI